MEYVAGFEPANLSTDWRKSRIFAGICAFPDLNEIYLKALKERPELLITVVPLWKKYDSVHWKDYIPGEEASVSSDSDAFLCGEHAALD